MKRWFFASGVLTDLSSGAIGSTRPKRVSFCCLIGAKAARVVKVDKKFYLWELLFVQGGGCIYCAHLIPSLLKSEVFMSGVTFSDLSRSEVILPIMGTVGGAFVGEFMHALSGFVVTGLSFCSSHGDWDLADKVAARWNRQRHCSIFAGAAVGFGASVLFFVVIPRVMQAASRSVFSTNSPVARQQTNSPVAHQQV